MPDSALGHEFVLPRGKKAGEVYPSTSQSYWLSVLRGRWLTSAKGYSPRKVNCWQLKTHTAETWLCLLNRENLGGAPSLLAVLIDEKSKEET